MTTLHEAARRVVAAWVGTSRTWVEDVNATVMALDAALKAQPEPAQQAEPKAGDYEARTGRALIWLYTAPPQRPTLTVPELQQALVDAGIIFPEAIDDAEGFDHGVTLERIDALHAAIIKTTGGAA